jgi:large subunit ribosomal protein L5
MESVVDKQKNTFTALKDEFNYANSMQAPKIEKVILSTGVGKTRADKRKIEMIQQSLAQIAGQNPVERNAKKSIASFKVREGQLAGFQVTIRGKRMHDFMDRLINVALPRTRDFRGLKTTVDAMGNYTIGIKDNSIFPETADQDIRDSFGMSIIIVTSSNNPKETRAFMRQIGMPLKKEEEDKKKGGRKK